MNYESPMVRARAIASGQVHVSRCQRHHAMKMVHHLHPMIIVDLEREETPIHLFRWVARVAQVSEQRRRTDLVIHLRRSITRPRNGWLEDWQCIAAMNEWDTARREARKRGGSLPAVHEVQLATYQAAIEGAKKKAQESETEKVEDEGDDAKETGGEDAEARSEAGDEPSEPSMVGLDDETEDEAEPISTRQPLQGREHVLRLLSDAVRAALAAKDLEAAAVANDAISRLCGRPEVG